MNIDEVKSLLKFGDVAGAEKAAQVLLASEPDNAAAQMLYGTCRHLLGDDKTFGKIHDALAPKVEAEWDENKLSLWHRYHGMWIALIAGGLVLAGVSWWSLSSFLKDFTVAAYRGPAYDLSQTTEMLHSESRNLALPQITSRDKFGKSEDAE